MTPTPLEWLTKLEGELGSRHADLKMYDDYYCGNHPLPFLTKAHEPKLRNEFAQLLEDSRSNFMRLVVDVVEERLKVEGFRLSAASDAEADKPTWDIWQANQMDADSQTAFVEALVKGRSYVSVWRGAKDGDRPTLAIEDPLQTIIGYEPGSNFRRRAAAVKIWCDDWTGKDRANVYLPEGIYKFEATSSSERATTTGDESTFGKTTPGGASSSSPQPSSSRWKEIDGSFVRNPLGVVPIIALRNRPRLLCEGESELADVYRVQNQINGFLFLLALAGYFGAHRQRWAAGITIMEDTNGKPVEPFRTAVDTLWTSDNPEARFGDFAQSDLNGYIASIEQKVLHIAVTTRTPRHYLIQQGQSPSGDAIKSAESGLTKKVERKQRPFGEGLEEALRLARRFAGEKDSPVDSEMVWADPEIRSEAEITDAAMKKLSAGLIDQHQALEDCGYTPQQITRILAAMAAAPVPEAPTPPETAAA